jgi:hypothetical protein
VVYWAVSWLMLSYFLKTMLILIRLVLCFSLFFGLHNEKIGWVWRKL